jgi:hypothetical protein
MLQCMAFDAIRMGKWQDGPLWRWTGARPQAIGCIVLTVLPYPKDVRRSKDLAG